MPVNHKELRSQALARANEKMLATQATTHRQDAHEAEDALYKQRDDLHAEVKEATDAESVYQDAEDDYSEILEANDSFINGDLPSRLSKLLVTIFGIIPAWMLDVVVFSGATAFFMEAAGFAVTGIIGGIILWIGRAIIPLGIIAFEIAISTLRYRAPDAQAKRFFTRMGIALVVVLSLIAVATFVATNFIDSSYVTLDLVALAIGFALLSPLPHLYILFSGKDAYEGKAYLLYMYLKRRVNKLACVFDDRLKDVLAMYRRCMRKEHQLREEFNHTPAPALYTADARRIINKAFDAEMVLATEALPAPHPPILNGTASD